jgi:hypothetical protein
MPSSARIAGTAPASSRTGSRTAKRILRVNIINLTSGIHASLRGASDLFPLKPASPAISIPFTIIPLLLLL